MYFGRFIFVHSPFSPVRNIVLVIQNTLPAHKALIFDFRKAEHFVEARFMIHVELMAFQLNNNVLISERSEANWTVTTLQEFEFVGIP